MPTATDALRAKTDAELQFFVDNPSYYHPDLVAAARQELRRRGLAPALLPSEPALPTAYDAEAPAPGKRPLLVGAALLGLAGVGAALFWASQPATPPPPAQPASDLSPAALKLETVEAQAIPNFDIDKIADDQVARIPAAEKQQAQPLRQFRGLCRRFWAAETQSEFLSAQAHAGKAGPTFDDQTKLVRQTWRDWNKAVVYSYKFGPTMQGQYERMARVASSQQHIMANLPALLAENRFLTDKEQKAREVEVEDWMRGVRRVSPVTGQAYKATVLKAHF